MKSNDDVFFRVNMLVENRNTASGRPYYFVSSGIYKEHEDVEKLNNKTFEIMEIVQNKKKNKKEAKVIDIGNYNYITFFGMEELFKKININEVERIKTTVKKESVVDVFRKLKYEK